MKCVVTTYDEIIKSYHQGNYSTVLCPSDTERANRFVHKADRDRFIASRLLCITELSKLKPLSEYQVEFELGLKGKPYLKGYPDFNWSHSGRMIALFIGPSAGIDVELVREVNIKEFESVFNQDQLEWIGNNRNRFFKLWTIKESIMKACGLGFHLDPLSIQIGLSQTNATWSVQIMGCTYFGITSIIKSMNQENYAVSLCSSSERVHQVNLNT